MQERALPPLNWLRAFEAAARHLSFTNAAGELNMTQSAVSQHIKSLESYLGQPLFYRRTRHLELTVLGQNYLPVVRGAFSTLTKGTRMLMSTGKARVLRVKTNMSFSTAWLAPHLPSLYDRHPDIHLYLTTAIWEPDQNAPDADVEIRFQVSDKSTSDFERLTWDHYYPVCAPNYDVSLEAIHNHRMFYCTGMLTTWDGWAEAADLPSSPGPRTTHGQILTTVMAAAESGAGLAMAHDTSAAHMLRTGRLIRPFVQTAQMQEAYYLGVNPAARDNSDAQNFAQWVRDEMAADQARRPSLGWLATHA